jgi:nicotinate-nucleotide adenylyltransferase
MRIGVYGGTFDPVHLGHLAAAEAVREAAALDRVLFVPNRRQPLKDRGPYAGAEQRLRMLGAALEGNPAFAVSSIELEAPGPSYSVATLEALHTAMPDDELRFVMGTDAANGLGAWREPARILAKYRPLVLARAGWPPLDWTALEAIDPLARQFVTIVEVPLLAIASSDLRARIAAGRSIRYLVPDAARRIIEDERIYAASRTQAEEAPPRPPS